MNCYNHSSEAAVAQCQDCSKGLCSSCSTNYSLPICNTCNGNRIKKEKDKIVGEMALTFGFSLLLTAGFTFSQLHYFSLNMLGQIVLMFLGLSGMVAGWNALSKMTSNYFLFLPIIGWAIYFILKLYLSMMIGVFVLPYRTYKNVNRLKELKSIII